MNAWLKISSLGLLVGALAAGCTISSDDDVDGIGGATTATGGNSTTGGVDAGGATSTGGTTGGTAGATSTGGTTAGGEGGAGTSEPSLCETCLQTNCETELDDCATTSDEVDAAGNVNADGVADCINEYNAFLACIEKAWEEDEAYYTDIHPDSDTVDVVTYCGTEAALVDTFVLTETNELVSCSRSTDTNCEVECYDLAVGMGGAGGAGGAGS